MEELEERTDIVITNTDKGAAVVIMNTNNYIIAKWLRRWIPNPGVPCSKPLGGSKVDSAFHLSEVDKMSTRNFWELIGKK